MGRGCAGVVGEVGRARDVWGHGAEGDMGGSEDEGFRREDDSVCAEVVVWYVLFHLS